MTTPTHKQSTAALITTAHIDRDLPCLSCKYNLRTLATDSVCPECQTAVRETLLAEQSPLQWAQRVRRGWLLLQAYAVCVLVYMLFELFARFIVDDLLGYRARAVVSISAFALAGYFLARAFLAILDAGPRGVRLISRNGALFAHAVLWLALFFGLWQLVVHHAWMLGDDIGLFVYIYFDWISRSTLFALWFVPHYICIIIIVRIMLALLLPHRVERASLRIQSFFFLLLTSVSCATGLLAIALELLATHMPQLSRPGAINPLDGYLSWETNQSIGFLAILLLLVLELALIYFVGVVRAIVPPKALATRFGVMPREHAEAHPQNRDR